MPNGVQLEITHSFQDDKTLGWSSVCLWRKIKLTDQINDFYLFNNMDRERCKPNTVCLKI